MLKDIHAASCILENTVNDDSNTVPSDFAKTIFCIDG